MALHELKVWPQYYEALADGSKAFELRKDDRGFAIGDELILREYSPGSDEYTGRAMSKVVSYMVRGDDPMGYAFGLRTGFVVLGLRT
jgi:hypothetical protein